MFVPAGYDSMDHAENCDVGTGCIVLVIMSFRRRMTLAVQFRRTKTEGYELSAPGHGLNRDWIGERTFLAASGAVFLPDPTKPERLPIPLAE